MIYTLSIESFLIEASLCSGQPLEEYIFSFIPESSGGQNTLKFSSNANISTIMSNFQTRQVEYWGEMEDRGAIYSPKNKMVTCEFW